ncbi:MAG: hypothetical protein JW757_13520 [Anaerolineales bacterium]|nr:hypothetical protein [Anaerolineales bacterium]
MKRSNILIVMVVCLVLILTTLVSAHKANPGVLPPDAKVQGLTYGEWSAKWWQYVLSIPDAQNPLTGGTGNQCGIQQIGNVGLVAFDPTLEEPIECQVPIGTMLFLDILSVECSNVEEYPFYGGDEAEMRSCATGFTITDLQAAIDGVEVQNLDRYLHTSPLFDFTLPEDNILYTDELVGQSVSYGAHLILNPLSPGAHSVHLHASIPEFEFTIDVNLDLTVLP